MDTSDEYVKMCKEATEIHEAWEPHAWDYFYIIDPRPHKWRYEESCADVITGTETDGGLYGYEPEHVIDDKERFAWLPRQDQLQDMTRGSDCWSPYGLVSLIHSFYAWCCDKAFARQSLHGMEQLWLAFVMDIKYNKVWNGEHWTEIQ